MWHISLPAPHNILTAFLDGISEPEFQRAISYSAAHDGEPCLLDIISRWVGYEDNILTIPSYDSLLIGILLIIDDWKDDRARLWGQPLWLDSETGEPRAVPNLTPRNPEDDCSYDHDLDVGIAHELFNRAAFEAARNLAHVRQQHRIEALLRSQENK